MMPKVFGRMGMP